jgi:hypothetical protein
MPDLATIALWWCYAFGALAAVGLYAVGFLWVADQLVSAFKVKRAILDWAWHRAKGYELYKPEIVTPKGGGRIEQ